MRKIFTQNVLIPILCMLFASAAQAQQEPQYTQFMFNKMAYNPGYAGSFVSATITAIYRNQWVGIDGAPRLQVLSYNQPWLNDRMGFGLGLSRMSIGINKVVTADFVYCYRAPMRRGHLGIGFMPSVRNISQNWTDDRLYSPTPPGTDIAIPVEVKNKFVVNFGLGAYFSNDKWYVGLSLPRVFTNNIDFAENGDSLSREVRHFNAMGGITLDVNDDLSLTPQMLLKYVPNTPFEAEINLSALVRDKFFGGLSYRAGGDTNGAGSSLNTLLGMQATKNLFFCLSYDIGLTRLRRYNNGSIEATARWWFNPPEGRDIDTGINF